MKKVVVLENDCGDEAAEYREWLEKYLPDDIELDWRERTSGIGGGLFDENGNEIDNPYWEAFCNR